MSTQNNSDQKRLTPPKTLIDTTPLTMDLDKNRESLKIKLMVRRSANQLVQQGILPDLKTSPAIHEQRQKLERAKTGDLLKAKIQQRPNRQELERRHILESHESHIDPSLAEKYRMLEKAILVDQLNSKISHRPGPLELIEKNILHANEPIERIVKEGLVEYKLMSVDDNNVVFEDDSQSSEGDLQSKTTETILLATPTFIEQQQQQQATTSSPAAILNGNIIKLNLAMTPCATATVIPKLTIKLPSDSTISHQINDNFITNPPPPPPPLIIKEMPSLDPIKHLQPQPPPKLITTTFTPENNNIKSHISSFIQNNQKIGSSGKDKNRKKCKIKPPIKSKAIKFHEYKGPPNASKSSASSSPSQSSLLAVNNNKKNGETNYELIMQQQCLLEYLEGIYKSPKSEMSESVALEMNSNSMDKITPLKHHENDVIKKEDSKKAFVTIFPSKAPQNSTTTSVNLAHSSDGLISDMSQLSKLKVSELKAFLKRFSLPVSGPKPLLVERLKPFLPLKLGEAEKSEDKKELKSLMESSALLLSNAMIIDAEKLAEGVNGDDIVKEQQRKIEELQRKLQESQQQLEKIKQIKQTETFPTQQSSAGASSMEKETNFFQLIPTNSNDLQNNLLYDQKSYQIASPISTVFVVAPSIVLAPEPSPSSSINALPMILQAEDNCKSIDNTPQSIMMMSEDTNDCNDDSEEYEDSEVTSNIMQDDISDVLEILLKNEKWPESPSAIKNNSDEHRQQPVLQSNVLSTTFHDPPSLVSEPMSPLLSNDGKRTPSHSIISANFDKHENDMNCNSNFVDCPMDIEDSSSMLMDSSDFKNSLALKKSPLHHLNNSNNNSMLSSVFETNKSLDVGVVNGVVGGIKNSLIGNFDNNMFDTFKNNNACNNNANSFFNNTSDHKDFKESERGYINNLNILNNFEIFSNSGMELSVPMDFENIIPYDIYQQDTFFNNALQNSTHDHRDSFNSAFFNAGNHDSNDMFSEVDNFLESEKV